MGKQIRNNIMSGMLCFLAGLTIPLSAATFNIANGDITALKSAITTANGNSQPDTINLAPFGVYKLTSAAASFTGDIGLPILNEDVSDANTLTIMGNGATITRDTTAAQFRLMYCINGVVIINNVNFSYGNLVSTSQNGAGLVLNGGTYTISNCTFLYNQAGLVGGAIDMEASSNVTISNCTFYGNKSPFASALYDNGAFTVYVYNSTISGNISTSSTGSAVENVELGKYFVNLRNSIVANNTNGSSGGDVSGGFISEGHNVVGYSVSAGVTAGNPNTSGDYVGASSAAPIDPKLNKPAYNGGFTQTMALQSGSPAINNGNTLYPSLYDQRGYARVGVLDIGAYEYNAVTPAPVIATTGLSITKGPIGSVLTIMGANMTGVTQVQFNGATVSSGFTNNDTISVTVVVPIGTTTGTLTVTTAAGTSAPSPQTFTVGTITGTSLASIVNLSVFPNPFDQNINITLSKELNGAFVKIYSVTGILQQQSDVTGLTSATIDTQGLKPGAYIMTISDAAGDSSTYSMIKN